MARNILCGTCGQEKTGGYVNGYNCSKCKHAKRSEERAKKRAEKGFRPWGSPSTICPDCSAAKEDISQTYCNMCRSSRAKKWRIETGRSTRVNSGLCPCGAQRGENQPRFCLPCKAEDSRKWRAAIRLPEEEFQRLRKERREKAAFKRSVRKITEDCIRIGLVVKQPCEVCKIEENVEAHHDDYNKPMDIRWLCRSHHLEHHKTEAKLLKQESQYVDFRFWESQPFKPYC